LGEPCNEEELRCEFAVGYCAIPQGEDEGTCVGTLELGTECSNALECESLHCASSKPNNPLWPETCQPGEPGARLHQPCDASIECELGGYCGGENECVVKTRFFDQCDAAHECYFGVCAQYGSAGEYCGGDACFFAWEDKIGG
jgi:hypothetical protein